MLRFEFASAALTHGRSQALSHSLDPPTDHNSPTDQDAEVRVSCDGTAGGWAGILEAMNPYANLLTLKITRKRSVTTHHQEPAQRQIEEPVSRVTCRLSHRMHGRYLLSILKGCVYDGVKVWVGIPVRPGKSLASRFAALAWLSLRFVI